MYFHCPDLQTAASELLRFREELQQDRAARNSEKAEQSANACQVIVPWDLLYTGSG